MGREVNYVDLELNPTSSAENPPDLARFTDAAQPYVQASQGSAGAVPAKHSALKSESKGKGKEHAAPVNKVPRGDDVDRITQSIMAKVGFSARLPILLVWAFMYVYG